MKSMIRLGTALLALALVLSNSVMAFADFDTQRTGVQNVIVGSTGESRRGASAPSASDIIATGDDKKIVLPNAGSYLAEYRVMYINAEKGHSVYAHKQPYEKENEKYMPFAFHGSKVIVLAEQAGYSCILYYSDSNERHAAWVPSGFLSQYYPGRTAQIGTQAFTSMADIRGDAEVRWSSESFVGSGQRYTILDEPVDGCVGFTLDYQVTARNGAATQEVLGPRTIYVNDGNGWIEVGQFDYNELGPVHVEVELDPSHPMRLAAVATVASCARPDTFLFRQSVLDVWVTR